MDKADFQEFRKLKTFSQLYQWLIDNEFDLLSDELDTFDWLSLPFKFAPGEYFKLLRLTYYNFYLSGKNSAIGCSIF